MSALATRVRGAVKARIVDLAIPEMKGVHEQAMPDETNVTFPCVLLTQDGLADIPIVRTSAYKIVGKPVRVMLADRHDQRFDHAKLPLYERIRQELETAFDGQALAGVEECSRCRIDELPLVDPNITGYMRVMTGFIVVAVCKVDIPGV